MAKRYALQNRKRLLDDYHRSDLTQEAFAAQNQINVGTLRGWLYRGRTAREEGCQGADRIHTGFVEVKTLGEAAVTHQPVRLVLHEEVCFEMERMPSPEYVIGLLRALNVC